MKILQSVKRTERLDAFILQKRTGTPVQLAEKLDIAQSTLYIMIDEL